MTSRPVLLDLFCGAGGAAMGYSRAGFEVIGVDHHPQPRYPFEFHLGDAMTWPLDRSEFIHASPPCQRYSIGTVRWRNEGRDYCDLVEPIRQRLEASGKIWVIENVIGSPLARGSIVLCGLMFGLRVFRHRVFECSHFVFVPPHPSHRGKRVGEGYYSVAGNGGRWKSWGTVKRNVSKGTRDQWRQAMGIDWMTRKELTQAIPPAYTEWIGRQLR